MSAAFLYPNPGRQPYRSEADNSNSTFLSNFREFSFALHAGVEERVDVPEIDNLTSATVSADTCGMKCLPVTVTDFLVDQFKVLDNVRSVLVGESDGVHHVWILLDEWSQQRRMEVYAIQREILKKVTGFNFDFYVLDIPAGERPENVVSEIPVAYYRD